LSSFGQIRAGVGKGEFYGQGNLRLKVSFEGEAHGTYRIYTYEWVSSSEYALLSKQYDQDGKPTGLFYKGNFVRVNTKKDVRKEIEVILDMLDNYQIPKEEQVAVYAEDVVHMAPGQDVIKGKTALLAYLNKQKGNGHAEMEHQIVELSEHGSTVVMRGQVKGIFYPKNGGDKVPFQTKNLFVFERISGKLKISKVIYNMSPVE
jgi:ketosteroid isomerase-like protein